MWFVLTELSPNVGKPSSSYQKPLESNFWQIGIMYPIFRKPCSLCTNIGRLEHEDVYSFEVRARRLFSDSFSPIQVCEEGRSFKRSKSQIRPFQFSEKYGMTMWILCLILNIISTLTCFLK